LILVIAVTEDSPASTVVNSGCYAQERSVPVQGTFTLGNGS